MLMSTTTSGLSDVCFKQLNITCFNGEEKQLSPSSQRCSKSANPHLTSVVDYGLIPTHSEEETRRSNGPFDEQCDDCINVNLCPEANELPHNSDSIEKLRKSLCGFETVARVRTPKICCDDFVQLETGNDDIEMHVNIALLPDDCGKISYHFIEETTADEYPWIALLSYRSRDGYEFKCGGSIINSRYVLTSAHCVKNKVLAGVRLGEYDIHHRRECQSEPCIYESHIQDVRIEKVIIHEQYDPMNLSVTNDIALLRVKDSIDVVGYKNVAPICLPVWKNLRNITLSKKIATVAGWGLAEASTSYSILKSADVSIFDAVNCFHYLKRITDMNLDNPQMKTICADGVRGKDSCNGDAGGPLMIENEYKNDVRVIQVGIASHGPRQCGSTAPVVYTDVTKYIEWILDNIEA